MVISSTDSGAVPALFSAAFQRDPYPTYHRCVAAVTRGFLNLRLCDEKPD
jgi:hypothetical protein